MSELPGILGQPEILIEILGAFVVLHQAIVELFKLTGVKSRRYWEALAYIVYGPTLSRKGTRQPKNWTNDIRSGRPSTVDPFFQGKGSGENQPYTNPQERLIQSFLLRGVGDSPVTDISDSDIRNVIQVVRFVEMNQGDRGLAVVSELLDEFIRTAPHNSTFITQQLSHIKREHPSSIVKALLKKWLSDLPPSSTPGDVKPATLAVWRSELNQQHFQAILRAERELPNALKAAEFQYVRHLGIFSLLAAVIGALLVTVLLAQLAADPKLAVSLHWYDYAIALGLSIGVLATVPRGTKSLLDAVIGLGNRMKG